MDSRVTPYGTDETSEMIKLAPSLLFSSLLVFLVTISYLALEMQNRVAVETMRSTTNGLQWTQLYPNWFFPLMCLMMFLVTSALYTSVSFYLRRDSKSSFRAAVLCLTDAAFLLLTELSLVGIAVYSSFTQRLVILPDLYAPEAYKIVVYSLFAFLVLRRYFGVTYGLVFGLVYTMAESIGNTTYILVHAAVIVPRLLTNFFYPFPKSDPTLTFVWLFFYAACVVLLIGLRSKLHPRSFWILGFLPFVVFVSFWISIGYPINITLLANNPTAPWVPFVGELSWMLLYLFGWSFALRRKRTDEESL